jgi:hypothetical protein
MHRDPDEQRINLPPWLVAAAGWALPGAGYWLIGHRDRAVIVCTAIIVLYILGLFIAGVRVIEVPGYDPDGQKIRVFNQRRVLPAQKEDYARADWALVSFGGVLGEIAQKPWFAAQILAGPLCVGSAAWSNSAARAHIPRPHAPLETVGTLYTAIAGMLNLMVIIDSAYRAGRHQLGEDA